MKRLTTLIFTLIFLTTASIALCSSMKTIQLKDGSTLKGEVLKLENGIYTIKTETLGQIRLKDSNIISIGTDGAGTSSTNPESLKSQVGAVQGQIFGDQAIMKDIEGLAQDEEVMKILQDPSLMKDILTFDENKIKNNPSVQKLLQNKEVNRIMKDVEKKIDQE